MGLLATLADGTKTATESMGGTTNNLVQFITVSLIFILVLVLTAITTKWIARYQKGQLVNRNIEVIETYRVTTNKWIQLVRVGESYFVIAVGKDEITLLKEIPKEQVHIFSDVNKNPTQFKTILEKTQILKSGKKEDPKEE